MKTEIKLITPEIAKNILENNVCNRPLKEIHVRNLATDMLSGRWRDQTSETIKITKSGRLIDGQHRLNAVIKANKSFKFLVATDLDNAIMDVIDSGVKRSAADVLNIRGVNNYSLVAAIIKSYLAGSIQQSTLNTAVTNRMIEEEYFKDTIFWDNVSKNASTWSKRFKALAGSFFGFCFAQALRNSENSIKCFDFFEALSTGKNCHEIIIDLRNKLINNHLSDRKVSHGYKLNMIRSYWNAWIKGRKSRDEKTEGWL